LSAPEAFALRNYVQSLPEERQRQIARRMEQAESILGDQGLWPQLVEISETTHPPDDEELEPINRAYYALRLPCPFLEQELCTIYEERPAACRELLVTSPAEWCHDFVANPVEPLPVAVRMSPALGLLWGELTNGPARLIPLPVALQWAERHRDENQPRWQGSQLLDRALDKIWRILSRAFQAGQEASG
jgi:Fe-S-cluster containining protein